MKRCCFLILLFSFALHSQNSTLEFESFTGSGGIYHLEKIKDRIGISGSLEATFSLNKNLLSITWSFGYGVLNRDEILKNTIHLFSELDLLYGRSFEFIPNVHFAIFSGIGITEQSKLKNKDNGTSFTVPIRGKLIYKASRFRFEIISHLNFNSQNDIYMYQVLLGYDF